MLKISTFWFQYILCNFLFQPNRKDWNMEKCNLKILYSFITYLCFLILYRTFKLYNAIIRKLLNRNTRKYKTYSLRGHILWRRKLHEYDSCSERDFICIYSSYVNSEFVLKPSVSLYSISKQEAIFIETEEHINIYSSDENAFLFFAQFEHSKFVIRMPIASFQALADKLGNPAMPVVWMSNTGRCGSTLLCQVLEKVPGTLLLSEPDAPSSVDSMRQTNEIADTDHDRLLVSTVRILCKPYPGTRMICIKTHNHSISLMKRLSRLYPSIKQIFIYRNCKETVASTRALLAAAGYTKMVTILMDSKWTTALKPFLGPVVQN